MAASEIECEVCIDSVGGAMAAEAAGADRVELCANLHEGGTTPSFGMIQAVLQATTLPVMVMIRPRGGDFCFGEQETRVMFADVECLLPHKQIGFVIGALTVDGDINLPLVHELVRMAAGRRITFHRAFDLTRDAIDSLEQLIELGCDRVLTSGQSATAEQGIPLLRDLTQRAQGRIGIMAGAGISPDNAARIIRETGVRQIHFSASAHVESPVEFVRPEVPMSSLTPPDDRLRHVTSQQRAQLICQAARAIASNTKS